MDNDITISTAGDLTLTAPISTLGGTGGTFTVIGGVTFTGAASILLGTGDITLNDRASCFGHHRQFAPDDCRPHDVQRSPGHYHQ